jgi:hypothetical protein
MFEQQRTEFGLPVLRLLAGLLAIALLIGVVEALAKYTALRDIASLSVVGAVFAFLIFRDVLQQRARARQIREFAHRMGLLYIGAALPKSFPLHRTSSGQARSITNVVSGDKGQKEILVFDCKLGYGKGRFSCTVVAVRGQEGGFGAARFGPDLLTEWVGEWEIVYTSRGLLLVEEIETLVGAF